MRHPYRTAAQMPVETASGASPRHVPRGLAQLVFYLAMFLLGLWLSTGCAWFQKNESYFPTPADVACVYQQVESGVSDPPSILAACPALVALALEDLLRLISGINLGKARRVEVARAAGATEHLTCVAHGADMICTTSPRDAGAEGGR